jgi:hypothetical protein
LFIWLKLRKTKRGRRNKGNRRKMKEKTVFSCIFGSGLLVGRAKRTFVSLKTARCSTNVLSLVLDVSFSLLYTKKVEETSNLGPTEPYFETVTKKTQCQTTFTFTDRLYDNTFHKDTKFICANSMFLVGHFVAFQRFSTKSKTINHVVQGKTLKNTNQVT